MDYGNLILLGIALLVGMIFIPALRSLVAAGLVLLLVFGLIQTGPVGWVVLALILFSIAASASA